MSYLIDSTPESQENNLNWDVAIADAGINASIAQLSLYQKLLLIELLVCKFRPTLRYSTYKALLRFGFVHDRNEPDYWGYMWDVLTADGMIAAFRLLAPEYSDPSFFYQLGRKRVQWEHAHRELIAAYRGAK